MILKFQLPLIFIAYFTVFHLWAQGIALISGFGFYPSAWDIWNYYAILATIGACSALSTLWTAYLFDNTEINKQQ